MGSRYTDKVVIVGGGIHGVSIAYYLSKRGCPSVIVERSHIAAAASGKSGGFLAREWGSGPTGDKISFNDIADVQLHHRSYDMHAELARDLKLASYRPIETLSVAMRSGGWSDERYQASWLAGRMDVSSIDSVTAQVTPLELTMKMLNAAVSGGCEVILDSVVGVLTEGSDGAPESHPSVVGVTLAAGGELKSSKVVFAMGPWTGALLESWLLGIQFPMEGIKSTSFVYENLNELKEPSDSFACFCDEDVNSCHLELYPRPNGDMYVCGCGGSDHVSGSRLLQGGDCEHADLIMADEGRVEASLKSFRQMTNFSSLKANPDKTQACMRPCPPDGLPVMSPICGYSGAFVSAGHNCWGILWAPISGLAMAELILDGHCASVDLSSFSLARFNNEEKGISKRGRKKVAVAIGEQW